jgi:hypothetical protein
MSRRFLGGLLAALLAGSAPAQSNFGGAAPEPAPLLRALPRNKLPFMFAIGFYIGFDGSRAFGAVDVDRDGDLDLLIGNFAGRTVRLLLNDGDGRFDEGTPTHMPNITNAGVFQFDMVDIDGDGDLDYVAGNHSSGTYTQTTILRNDGSGHFADVSRSSGITLQSYPHYGDPSGATGDFDGDGDADLVLSGAVGSGTPQSCRLLRNDGAGIFTYDASAFPVDQGRYNTENGDLRAADLDGDGDLDIVGPGVDWGMACFLNDGSGHFTNAQATHLPASAGRLARFAALRLGDVDRDGDLDIVASQDWVLARPFLFLNDGTGHFTDVSATQMPNDARGGAELLLADFDGDGDLDLLTVLYAGIAYPGFLGSQEILINDGLGRFARDPGARMIANLRNGGAQDAIAADFDQDGDLDLVVGSNAARPDPPVHIPYYVNTTRQLWADAAPRRGQPWRLSLCAPVGTTAYLALSPLRGNLHLPGLGRLGLDPASLTLWGNSWTIPAERQVACDLAIPNLGQIQGAPLCVQALLLEPGGAVRLSNTWSESSIQ